MHVYIYILTPRTFWPPVLLYISVSSTRMLTSSPEASTWSRPPKPMSYAQPSPPCTTASHRTPRHTHKTVSIPLSHAG